MLNFKVSEIIESLESFLTWIKACLEILDLWR